MAKKGEANVYMSYVNLGEVYYIIYREEGVDKANETLALIKRFFGFDNQVIKLYD